MNKIPSSVPVFIQNLENQNGRYSTAKLKIFYVGETADHRLFTKNFSDNILKTLPSTPVVGYYSEEDEDFKGHNAVQYVYGHVPENATIEYEEDEESGNTFAVTDVILYTERKDNIGAVAQKIVGKQHSLELDPDTLQYKINRDNSGKFINIEFMSGSFIGLSVLGDDETPAFKGSGFFSTNEEFKEFAAKCHNNFDKFLNFLNKNGGTLQVFNSVDFFSKLQEFRAKTMQEFQQDIYSVMENNQIYGYISENTTDYVVVEQYCMESNNWGYYKYDIVTDENGSMSLQNPVAVKPRFLTEDESNSLDIQNTPIQVAAEASLVVEQQEEVAPTETFVDDKEKEKEKDDEEESVPAKENKDDEEDSSDDEEEEKKKDKVGNATSSTCSAALSDVERAELEQYRRAAKVSVIDSYAEDLDAATLQAYKDNVDNYQMQELEAILALEYRKFMKSKPAEGSKTIVAFASIAPTEDYNENNPADVIKKYNKNK